MGLMGAAFSGTDKMVELLLPGSDAKAANKYGKTALMEAARSRKENNEKSVELLIPVSHVKATNSDGEDAIYYALFINDRDCDQIVRLLKGTPSDLLFCPRNNNK